MDFVQSLKVFLEGLKIFSMGLGLEMNIICSLLLSIGIHDNDELMGILKELLKLFISLSRFSGFGELVLKDERIFGIIVF